MFADRELREKLNEGRLARPTMDGRGSPVGLDRHVSPEAAEALHYNATTFDKFEGKDGDKRFTEQCVKAFLAVSESILSQSRDGARGLDGISSEKATQQARRAWAGISRARLFMVKPDRWAALYQAADRFTEERAGNEWEAYDPKKPVDEERTAKLLDFYASREATTWAFPDPLPFDACFFCYGLSLKLGGTALASRTRLALGNLTQDVRLVGHLLFWEGDTPIAYQFMVIPDVDATGGGMAVAACYVDGEWFQPMSLDPWILGSIVAQVNEHKSIVQDYAPTLANRLDRKKASKNAKHFLPLPAPFYLVHLKDELITPQQQAQANALGPGKLTEWSHRWDVRGHECVRFAKGKLPIDPKAYAVLKKKGYRVYEGRSLSAEDAQRLMKRGERGPAPDEWVAVLSYWRDAFVKGPKDRPYVPGARI